MTARLTASSCFVAGSEEEEGPGLTGEPDQVDAVDGPQPTEGAEQALLRLPDRAARHGTGRVDDEGYGPRRRRCGACRRVSMIRW